jgi:osmotically-inducible protein OsmY
MKLLTVLMAFMLSCAVISGVSAQPLGEPSDSTITNWVETTLATDPRIYSTDIIVSTHDGIVTLGGNVQTLVQKEYADLEAKKVRSVLGVINEITVKTGNRTDQQVEEDVTSWLRETSSIKFINLKVKVSQGLITLYGTVNSQVEKTEAGYKASEVPGVTKVQNELVVDFPQTRPDPQIQQDVHSTLQRDVYLTGFPITVTVNNGYVNLQGNVATLYQEERAFQDALKVWNVKGVENHLQINPWENGSLRQKAPYYSDTEIQQAVENALMQDLRITDPYHIEIDVSYGHVTLRGSVPNMLQRRYAARDVQNIVGVVAVTNLLNANVYVTRNDLDIQGDVEDALASDPNLHDADINVTVNRGVVALEGLVNNYYKREDAGVVAEGIPGVKDVINEVMVDRSSTRPSTMIENGIRERLRINAETASVADQIRVQVMDGIAILSGDVNLWSQRREAAQVAYLMDGVQRVENRLTVHGVNFPAEKWYVPDTSASEISK